VEPVLKGILDAMKGSIIYNTLLDKANAIVECISSIINSIAPDLTENPIDTKYFVSIFPDPAAPTAPAAFEQDIIKDAVRDQNTNMKKIFEGALASVQNANNDFAVCIVEAIKWIRDQLFPKLDEFNIEPSLHIIQAFASINIPDHKYFTTILPKYNRNVFNKTGNWTYEELDTLYFLITGEIPAVPVPASVPVPATSDLIVNIDVEKKGILDDLTKCSKEMRDKDDKALLTITLSMDTNQDILQKFYVAATSQNYDLATPESIVKELFATFDKFKSTYNPLCIGLSGLPPAQLKVFDPVGTLNSTSEDASVTTLASRAFHALFGERDSNSNQVQEDVGPPKLLAQALLKDRASYGFLTRANAAITRGLQMERLLVKDCLESLSNEVRRLDSIMS
jgi:hypothetical protein